MTETPARTGTPSAGRFVALLLVVVAVLTGLHRLLRPDSARRNVEYMPEMVRSPAVESQSLATMLPGGLSQQPLVAGVVPRGSVPFRYGVDEEEAKRAGRELSSPIAADDAAAAARGAEVFRIHCVPCHDATGGGQGLAVQRGMLPPPLLQGANAVQMPDGQMFHLLTLGRGNMPAMRARLPVADRWSVIRHVRELQAAPPADAPPATGGNGKEEDQ